MDIYKENILDHYHEPRNTGTIENPTHAHCANNPTCGDKICITLIIKDDCIDDIKFVGEGCAISQAATSMITEKIKSTPVADVLNITRDDVIKLLGIDIGAGRIRCALLGIKTIQKAIKDPATQPQI
jgi:nitrogen fixation NifU-like protein